MATKDELREQITAAGLEQPPASATKADLLAVLDLDARAPGHPAPKDRRGRPGPRPRSSAIRSED